MNWRKTVFIALFALTAASVSAQVHRCKDTTGKLIFSDRPCEVGHAGGEIQRQRTSAEIHRERVEASEAEFRKQNRREADESRLQQLPSRPIQAQGGSTISPYGCRKAKEELDLAMSLRTLTDEQKRIRVHGEQIKVAAACGTSPPSELPAPQAKKAPPPPPPQPRPTMITNCVPGFCYDEQGGVYHKAGPDFMTGPNGKACHRAGNFWNCH